MTSRALRSFVPAFAPAIVPTILALLGATSACGSSSSADPSPQDSGVVGDLGTGAEAAPEVGGDAPGSCTTDPAPKPGKVVVDAGALLGVASGKTWAFLGVPYAAPPTGALRWKPPAPAACWSGERAATSFGTVCVQNGAGGVVVGNEDCLTVNVWTPTDFTPDAKLPVMVFIHGGANVEGSTALVTADGTTHLYDGANLAARGHAVVVTLNYRLGAMGFFSHPGLDAERPEKVSGNWAIHDQIAALKWVQRNAHAFGGDPSHVLLFGESAGAMDAAILYASPLASGLFTAVALESGLYRSGKLADAETYSQGLVDGSSCKGAADPIACLRALPAEAIVAALPQNFDLTKLTTKLFGPSVDGWVLPEPVVARIAAGKHNAAPLVVGTNAQELAVGVPDMTDAEYKARLDTLGGSTTAGDLLLSKYPVADWGTPRDAYVALITDATFTCDARRLARAASKGQTQPVRRYFFTHVLQNAGAIGKRAGAFHGLDLGFLFDHLAANGYAPSAGESALADAMGKAWTSLAVSGDPTPPGAPAWPLYGAADPYLQLEDPIATGAGVRTALCDFWDTILK
ncbi:MAG: carboxylesterase family protein [Polyangiales bacterium]